MKQKFLIALFLSFSWHIVAEENALEKKSSIRSRIDSILSEFQNEMRKEELAKLASLPETASPNETITYFEVYLERLNIPFALLSRLKENNSTNAHYEVASWANLSFLARKFTRKHISRIRSDFQILKDESGESMTIHLELGSATLLLGLHKKHPKGRVCIIVDDMGHFGKGFPIYLAMNQPVAFSILPFYNTSPLQAKASYKEGFELMLHVPMEPSHGNYFKYENIIERDLDEKLLVSRVKTVFEQVPLVSGWNNHQGSKATADKRTMEIIMKELSQRRPELYFVDSMTSPDTYGYAMARKFGIQSAKRNFDFLDNNKSKPAIQSKIHQLINKARVAHNPVIAILHETWISAISLKEMLPKFQDEEIELISPTDFL